MYFYVIYMKAAKEVIDQKTNIYSRNDIYIRVILKLILINTEAVTGENVEPTTRELLFYSYIAVRLG